MHTLFALEDLYGLHITEADGKVCLQVSSDAGRDVDELNGMLCAWREQADKLERGEITRDEYDRWRYRYPEFDTTRRHAKVISQGLSDFLTDALKDK